MDDLLHLKKKKLEEYLKKLGSVAVAFSSGVDSTFLLKVAKDALGNNVIALTVASNVVPKREVEEAKAFCKKEGIEHMVLTIDELEIEGFAQNPENRCYICKRAIFTKLIETAEANGISYVVEGSNTDDSGDYRPGLKAIKELGIKSPLMEAGFSKSEIRALSKELGLDTWEKPSYACLASRFVYGQEITHEKLLMVERAEQFLIDNGFRQVRVRIHDNIARIEVERCDMQRLFDMSEQVNKTLRDIGFMYVTMDLGGFVSGSMNRMLK